MNILDENMAEYIITFIRLKSRTEDNKQKKMLESTYLSDSPHLQYILCVVSLPLILLNVPNLFLLPAQCASSPPTSPSSHVPTSSSADFPNSAHVMKV